MGLTVVGFLSGRHGIEVELRPSIGGGVVAEVAVPGALLSFTAPPKVERVPDKPVAMPAPAPPRPVPMPAPRQRENAPLFNQSAAPAPAPGRRVTCRSSAPRPPPGPGRSRPDRTRNAIEGDTRPLPVLSSAASTYLSELPEINFELTVVHADPSLRAGQALPQAESAPPLTGAGGLPTRKPMSNLVPGAIAPSPGRDGKPIERNPRSIGATYSAYARGLSGTRSPSPNNKK